MSQAGAKVTRVAACDVTVGDGSWPFIEARRDAIAAHWQARTALNSRLFDGTIYMLHGWELVERTAGLVFAGCAVKVPFSAHLYWRERDKTGDGIRHVFGVCALRALDGGIMLISAAPGTMNAGFWQLPGGFADDGDVVRTGDAARLDLAGLASRELAEECGIQSSTSMRRDGFVVCEHDNEIGVCSVVDCALPGAELVARVTAFSRGLSDGQAELSEAMIVRSASELAAVRTDPYCAAIATELLRP